MADIIIKSKGFHKTTDKIKDDERRKDIIKKGSNKKLASDKFLDF